MAPASRLTALLLLAATAAPTLAQEAPPERTPTRHALLVGVSEYPRLREELGEAAYRAQRVALRGPAGDVELLRDVLEHDAAFPPENIVVLSESAADVRHDDALRPARAAILREFSRLARTDVCRSGDLVFIHLSGHGSQIPTTAEDERDGRDEAFLPADAGVHDAETGAWPGWIRDDEIHDAVAAIRRTGARVWITFDACHAGSMVRAFDGDEPLTWRRIEPELLGVPREAFRGGSLVGAREDTDAELGDLDGVVALYAAQSYRLAPELELPLDGAPRRWYGLFTYTLATRLAQLCRAGGDFSFADLHAQIVAKYASWSRPDFPTPEAEGDLRTSVFGGAPTVRDVGVRFDPARGLVADAGRLLGVEPGTVLAVHAPGRADAAELARVRVLDADLLYSRCALVAGSAFTPEGDVVYPASVVSRALPPLPLTLAVVRPDGTPVEAADLPDGVVQVLDANRERFPRAASVAEARWLLVVDGERLSLAQGETGLATRGGATSAESLESDLLKVFRWCTLKRIADPGVGGALPEGLRVRLLVTQPDGSEREVGAGDEIHPGQKGRVSIRYDATGAQAYDVTVLELDSDYGISAVFPGATGSPRLAPADRNEVSLRFRLSDAHLGPAHLLVIAAPRVAGVAENNLSFLAQEPLALRDAVSRRDESPLARTLRDLATGDALARGDGGSLDFEAGPAAPVVSLLSWRNAWPRAVSRDMLAASPPELVLGDSTRCWWAPFPETAAAAPAPATAPRGPEAMAVYAKVAPAVVLVETDTGHGTGFVVEGGDIVTNHHVIEDGFAYGDDGLPYVRIRHGTLGADGFMQLAEGASRAAILLDDPRRDLALLRPERSATWVRAVRPVALADAPARPGADCFAIGNPASGVLWSLRDGLVAGGGRHPHDLTSQLSARLAGALERELPFVEPTRFLASDCHVTSGDSGGPLLDAQGRLLGVTFRVSIGDVGTNLTYHIDLSELRTFLEGRPAPAAAPAVKAPDVWRVGPQVRYTYANPASDSGVAPHLVYGYATRDGRAIDDERPFQILLDLDRDTAGAATTDAEVVAKFIRRREFDFEVALHLEPDSPQLAFYDTDNRDGIDLALADADHDGTAEQRWSRRADGSWSFEDGLAVPWLQASYLTYLDAAALADAREQFARVFP